MQHIMLTTIPANYATHKDKAVNLLRRFTFWDREMLRNIL